MNNRRLKGPAYKGTSVPITYALSYLIILLLAGYALGVQIVNPLDPFPSGYASLNPDMGRYNATEKKVVIDLLKKLRSSASPPGYADKPRVTTTGFSVMQPLPGTLEMNDDGNIRLDFMKALPTPARITHISITNTLTGLKCPGIEISPQELGSVSDSFHIEAQGCDTSVSLDEGAVLTYDVSVEYSMVVGSMSSNRASSGKIHIW